MSSHTLGAWLILAAGCASSDDPQRSSASCDEARCTESGDVSAACSESASEASGYACACTSGYAFDGATCVDEDGCEGAPCGTEDADATCADVAAPGTGYTCGCTSGYAFDGATCVDEDGCEGAPCGTEDAGATCADVAAPGTGYTCTCSDGYQFDLVACAAVPRCQLKDVDGDGRAMYPWGADMDDDGDGETTYLLGGRDTDDRDPAVVLTSGDGSFVAGDTFALATMTSPSAATTGDFDDDGAQDVAMVTNEEDLEALEVWLGDGEGRFSLSEVYDSDYGNAVVAGDLDSDGALDLFKGSTMFLGLCDGRFQSDTLGAQIVDAHTVDLNGDDMLDIVGHDGLHEIVSLLGQADGSFTEMRQSLRFMTHMSIGWLDGDAYPDVVVTIRSTSVKTLLGTEAGTFTEQDEVNASLFAKVIADADGDGHTDVIGSYLDQMNLMLGDGLGHIGDPSTLFTGNTGVNQVKAVDLDADGDVDLAFVDQYKGLAVSLGRGDGTFDVPVYFEAGPSPTRLEALADLQGDGTLDGLVISISDQSFTIAKGL